MHYLINVFGIILILPTISIGINIFVNYKKNINNNLSEITRLLQYSNFDEIITLITNIFIIMVSIFGIIKDMG